jgi:hypothetical protein
VPFARLFLDVTHQRRRLLQPPLHETSLAPFGSLSQRYFAQIFPQGAKMGFCTCILAFS